MTDPAERPDLLRRALRLEWLTVAWMAIEAAAAILSGLAAGSLALLAFGIDSVIELASAVVLIWRLSAELDPGRKFTEATERRAARLAGALLLALAFYIVAAAAWRLWQGDAAEFSWPGLVVALAAIPVMALLSRRKLLIAEGIGSQALRADAMEAVTCLYLSFIVVIGQAAQWLISAWWIDPVAALAIVFLLVKEGLEAWRGEADDD